MSEDWQRICDNELLVLAEKRS